MIDIGRQMRRVGIIFLSIWYISGTALADSKQASYKVELRIDWSKKNAPFEYPDGAHLSSLIGLTHSNHFTLFSDGTTASSGLELVAENGRAGILKAHFDELERKDRVGAVIEADGIKSVPGKINTVFNTTEKHSLLSLITMIAPSPDWFTGVSSVQLRANDAWLEAIQLPLWVWDAGTDSGQTFIAKNADTQPRESTRLLATPHFLNSDGLIKIGTISIQRQN